MEKPVIRLIRDSRVKWNKQWWVPKDGPTTMEGYYVFFPRPTENPIDLGPHLMLWGSAVMFYADEADYEDAYDSFMSKVCDEGGYIRWDVWVPQT